MYCLIKYEKPRQWPLITFCWNLWPFRSFFRLGVGPLSLSPSTETVNRKEKKAARNSDGEILGPRISRGQFSPAVFFCATHVGTDSNCLLEPTVYYQQTRFLIGGYRVTESMQCSSYNKRFCCKIATVYILFRKWLNTKFRIRVIWTWISLSSYDFFYWYFNPRNLIVALEITSNKKKRKERKKEKRVGLATEPFMKVYKSRFFFWWYMVCFSKLFFQSLVSVYTPVFS